jgi:hypothetical protein
VRPRQRAATGEAIAVGQHDIDRAAGDVPQQPASRRRSGQASSAALVAARDRRRAGSASGKAAVANGLVDVMGRRA